MARITSGINATSENEFYIGDGADSNKSIFAHNTQVTPPGIRHNKYLEDWELSTDGVNWLTIVGGGSSKLIVVPATIEIDILKGSVAQSEEIPVSIGACYINNSRWPANRTVTYRCILEASSEDGYYAAVADLYDSGGSLGTPAHVIGSQIDNTGVSYPTVSSVVEADLTSVFAGVVDGVFESRLWIETAGDGYFVSCKSAQIIVESVSGDVFGSADQNWRKIDNWTTVVVDGYVTRFELAEDIKGFADVNTPIRALDGYGVLMASSTDSGCIEDFSTLTGLETAISEPSGRLHFPPETSVTLDAPLTGFSTEFNATVHVEITVVNSEATEAYAQCSLDGVSWDVAQALLQTGETGYYWDGDITLPATAYEEATVYIKAYAVVDGENIYSSTISGSIIVPILFMLDPDPSSGFSVLYGSALSTQVQVLDMTVSSVDIDISYNNGVTWPETQALSDQGGGYWGANVYFSNSGGGAVKIRGRTTVSSVDFYSEEASGTVTVPTVYLVSPNSSPISIYDVFYQASRSGGSLTGSVLGRCQYYNGGWFTETICTMALNVIYFEGTGDLPVATLTATDVYVFVSMELNGVIRESDYYRVEVYGYEPEVVITTPSYLQEYNEPSIDSFTVGPPITVDGTFDYETYYTGYDLTYDSTSYGMYVNSTNGTFSNAIVEIVPHVVMGATTVSVTIDYDFDGILQSETATQEIVLVNWATILSPEDSFMVMAPETTFAISVDTGISTTSVEIEIDIGGGWEFATTCSIIGDALYWGGTVDFGAYAGAISVRAIAYGSSTVISSTITGTVGLLA